MKRVTLLRGWILAGGLLLAIPTDAAEPRPADEAIEKHLIGETKLLSLNGLAEVGVCER